MRTTSWMCTTRPIRTGCSVVSKASTDTCPRIMSRKETKLPALQMMALPQLRPLRQLLLQQRRLLPRNMLPSRESERKIFQKVRHLYSDMHRLLATNPLRQLSRTASLLGPHVKNRLGPPPLPASNSANANENTAQSPATAGTRAGRPHDLPRIAAANRRNRPSL